MRMTNCEMIHCYRTQPRAASNLGIKIIIGRTPLEQSRLPKNWSHIWPHLKFQLSKDQAPLIPDEVPNLVSLSEQLLFLFDLQRSFWQELRTWNEIPGSTQTSTVITHLRLGLTSWENQLGGVVRNPSLDEVAKETDWCCQWLSMFAWYLQLRIATVPTDYGDCDVGRARDDNQCTARAKDSRTAGKGYYYYYYYWRTQFIFYHAFEVLELYLNQKRDLHTFASLRYLHCNKCRIYSHLLRSPVDNAIKRGVRELKKVTLLSHAPRPEESCVFTYRRLVWKSVRHQFPGCEMFTSGFHSRLKNVASLSNLSIELFRWERLSLYLSLTSWKTTHRFSFLCPFKGMV